MLVAGTIRELRSTAVRRGTSNMDRATMVLICFTHKLRFRDIMSNLEITIFVYSWPRITMFKAVHCTGAI